MFRYLNLIQNVTNWPLYFLLKFGISKGDPARFRGKNNITIEVPKRLLHEFKEIFFENAYTIGLMNKIPNDPVIIDIGANTGFFTLFAASKYPNCTIYSYEPIAFNYQQLLREQSFNTHIQINCFNQAVCGKTGTVSINYDQRDDFTTSASILNAENSNNLSSVEVPCLSLSDVFSLNHIDVCHFLKLDCEGAEYEILYRASRSVLGKIDQIAMETHQGNGPYENTNALMQYLKDHQFNVFQFDNKPHMLWASHI